jgi:hypothetical protein
LDDLVLSAAVIGGLVALTVTLVALFLVRRWLLARPVGAFDCSLRRGLPEESPTWMLGVARYEADRLDWFKVFGLSPRPGRTLSRTRLVVLETRKAKRGEGNVGGGSVVVRCGYGTLVLELAMSEPDYNGFAAWIESAPPAPPLFSP